MPKSQDKDSRSACQEEPLYPSAAYLGICLQLVGDKTKIRFMSEDFSGEIWPEVSVRLFLHLPFNTGNIFLANRGFVGLFVVLKFFLSYFFSPLFSSFFLLAF